jgi:hypothetical protein
MPKLTKLMKNKKNPQIKNKFKAKNTINIVIDNSRKTKIKRSHNRDKPTPIENRVIYQQPVISPYYQQQYQQPDINKIVKQEINQLLYGPRIINSNLNKNEFVKSGISDIHHLGSNPKLDSPVQKSAIENDGTIHNSLNKGEFITTNILDKTPKVLDEFDVEQPIITKDSTREEEEEIIPIKKRNLKQTKLNIYNPNPKEKEKVVSKKEDEIKEMYDELYYTLTNKGKTRELSKIEPLDYYLSNIDKNFRYNGLRTKLNNARK